VTKNVVKVDYSITAPKGMSEESIVEKVMAMSPSAVVSMANSKLQAAGISVQFTDLAPPSAPTPKSDDSDGDGEFPIVLVVVVAAVGAVLLCAALVFIGCKKSMEARKRRESKTMEENNKETPVAENMIVLQVEPEVPSPPPAPKAFSEEAIRPVLNKQNSESEPSTADGGSHTCEELEEAPEVWSASQTVQPDGAQNSRAAFMMSVPPAAMMSDHSYQGGPPFLQIEERTSCNCAWNSA